MKSNLSDRKVVPNFQVTKFSMHPVISCQDYNSLAWGETAVRRTVCLLCPEYLVKHIVCAAVNFIYIPLPAVCWHWKWLQCMYSRMPKVDFHFCLTSRKKHAFTFHKVYEKKKRAKIVNRSDTKMPTKTATTKSLAELRKQVYCKGVSQFSTDTCCSSSIERWDKRGVRKKIKSDGKQTKSNQSDL